MAGRMDVCVPVATVLLLLSLTPFTPAAPTVHLGAPIQDSQPSTGPQGNGVQTSSDHQNSAADRPYIVEPTWFTVTTSPIDGSDASGQLTGRMGMPVLPAQPATMRPYVAYIPIAPAYQPHHLPPGWPSYLPGVLPAYPMPPNNHLCNQPRPSGYQLM
uniref:Putative secreted peptide n=1 Tax=Anopheles braziliensis TaxID=58242 RepID=A0A2M3ZED2_9DIPT